MKKDLWKLWAATFLGVWVFMLPVLGFPRSIKSALFSLSGLLVAALSFLSAKSLAREYVHHDHLKEDSHI